MLWNRRRWHPRRWARRVKKGVLEELIYRGPPVGVPIEAQLDAVPEIRVRVVRYLDFVLGVANMKHLWHNLFDVRKWRLAKCHLVQDAAERPNIRRPVEPKPAVFLGRRVANGLGRHVIERPDLRLAHNVGGVIANLLCNAKIDNLEPSVDADKVGRLEVEVNNLFPVAHLHTLEHLAKIVPDSVCIESWFPFDNGGQVELCVLKYHVDRALSRQHRRVNELDYVILLAQIEQEVNFGTVIGDMTGVLARIVLDDLERVNLQVLANDTVHLGAPALAEKPSANVLSPIDNEPLSSALGRRGRHRALSMLLRGCLVDGLFHLLRASIAGFPGGGPLWCGGGLVEDGRRLH